MHPFLWAILTACLASFIDLSPAWFDSAELATAAHTLGVAHPPGHAVYSLFAKGSSLLIPTGSIAFRMTLVSTITGVIGAGFLSSFLLRLKPSFTGSGSKVVVIAFSFLVSVLFLIHPSIGIQVSRLEVYSLQTALTAFSLCLGVLYLDEKDTRYLYINIFVIGLAIAAQPLLGLILLLPMCALIGIRIRKGAAPLGIGLPFLCLGYTVNLFLPLRATTLPYVNWDQPETVWRLVRLLRAQDYQAFLSPASQSSFTGNLLTSDLWQILPLPILLLSIIGVVGLWRRHKKTYSLFLGTAALGTALIWFLRVWAGDFDLRNPDIHGYIGGFIFVSIATAILGADYLVSLFSVAPRWATFLPLFIVIAVFGRPIFLASNTWASSKDQSVETLNRHMDFVPPRSVIEVGSDHWVFPFWYRQGVEGTRPDVAILATGLQPASWYRRQILLRHGLLKPEFHFLESDLNAGTRLFGYLLGNQPSPSWLVDQFGQECAQISNGDPFRIRQSICSTVVLAPARQLQSVKRYSVAIRFLERHLITPPSHVECVQPSPLLLPFPLSKGSDPHLLSGPDEPAIDLALLYLGCGEVEVATSFLDQPKTSGSTDATLLRSYLLWKKEKLQEGITLLEDFGPDTPLEAGFVALARATLLVERGDIQKAEKNRILARQRLGNHPAVVEMEKRLKAKK